jgi:hypothetical protein
MSTLHLSDTLLDGYVALFTQLGPQDQAILLNKLTESMKTDVTVPESVPEIYYPPKPANPHLLEELCGAWQDDRSAEEIIEDLRKSRTPNLDRVNL